MDIIEKLPISKERKWTFLETIGVSKKETIMAKLLAYYFNPEGVHGLRNIFIKTLLQTKSHLLYEHKECEPLCTIEELKNYDFEWANIKLEVTTDNDNKIDIVIETEKIVIAIEFKINHYLDNPLDDYYKYINDHYAEKETKYFIVLTPKWKKPIKAAKNNNKENEFKQIILSHFIDNVEKTRINKGRCFGANDAQQHQIYQDFINTIENRKIKIKMMEEYFKLVEGDDNDDNLNKLDSAFRDMQYIKKKIESKVEELRKKLPDFDIIEDTKNKLNSAIHRKYNHNFHLKIRLSLKGWTIEHWEINSGTQIIDKDKPKTLKYESSLETVLIEVKTFIKNHNIQK